MNQPEPLPGTLKEILRAVRILFGAIIAGAIMFAIIVLVLNKIQKADSVKKGNISFLILCIGVAAAGLVIAWSEYNKGITFAKNSLMSLPDKLNQYRSALVRYIALCEAPVLSGIILFFMNGDYLSLIVAAVMIAAIVAKTPTLKKVVDDLGLDWKQQQELE